MGVPREVGTAPGPPSPSSSRGSPTHSHPTPPASILGGSAKPPGDGQAPQPRLVLPAPTLSLPHNGSRRKAVIISLLLLEEETEFRMKSLVRSPPGKWQKQDLNPEL